MDFVPEIVDGTVVLNAIDTCSAGNDCRSCMELAVGIHNWMVVNQLRYLMIDFQDEKDVCTTILTELLQLRKRFRQPFLFCGMMVEPKKFLKSYGYDEHHFFRVPEEGAVYLKTTFPQYVEAKLASIKVGEPIPCTRSRTYRSEEIEEVEGEEVEPETDS